MIERWFPGAMWWEWHWTLWPLGALVLRLWLLELVASDVVYWHGEHTREPLRDVEPEQIWTGSQLLHKLALAAVLLIMTVFGVIALRTPPVITPPPPPTRVTYALTWVSILIPAILAVDAVQTLVNRFRTKRADDERTANQRRRATDVVPDHTSALVTDLDAQIQEARKDMDT